MGKKSQLNSDISRRRFIQLSSTLALCSQLTSPLSAFGSSKEFSLKGLEEQILSRVKELVGQKQLSLELLFPDGCQANIQPVADKFAEQTGVKIKLRKVPVENINTTMMIEAAAGDASFDLALPATFGLPDLVEAGALKDLSEFAKRYEPSDFREDSLYTIGDYYKGNLYGYQTDGDTYLMFYLKDWLENPSEQKRFADKFSYELRVPRTWQELDDMIKFFHRPDENKFGGALFRTPDYIAWEWWIRFHSQGFFPFDDNLEPQVDNDVGVKALEDLIAVSQYLYPKASTYGLFDNWEAYAQGNIFCNIGWGGTQKYLNSDKSKVKGKLAFGLTPGGMVNGQLLETPYFNWGWNYTVGANSKNPEIAYLFALFACSPRCSTMAVREQSGYFDPFRKEHYLDKTIEQTYSAEFLSVHQESMIKSFPDFYLKGQGEYFDVLREYLTLAYKKSVSPKKALSSVAKAWRTISSRMGKSSQLEQWQFLKGRYPKAFRSRVL